ncbi:MAG: TIGR04283 family arsenosugar biosynthesis glycosyltransferase [Acidobacteria bacterium]|nr:TIGR04283 family arsenosugar biosynthesis glycosyltransferase [Acidobacteriota bacterium]
MTARRSKPWISPAADSSAQTQKNFDMLISTIIPVLNEEQLVVRCLRQFEAQPGGWELIVVDGGSTDATLNLAEKVGSARILTAPRGRGTQMNVGAASATGRIFLFLHSDVILPKGAHHLISKAMADPTAVAGAFRTWTVPEKPCGPVLAALLHLADLRSRYTSLPYGDQTMFVRAETFRQVGGFRQIPLMEDLDFSRRVRRLGRVQILRASVRVSGRRLQASLVRYTILMNLFPLLYRLRFPVRRLADFYGDPR